MALVKGGAPAAATPATAGCGRWVSRAAEPSRSHAARRAFCCCVGWSVALKYQLALHRWVNSSWSTGKMVWEGSDIAEEVISQVEFAGFSSHIYCFPLLPSGLQSAFPQSFGGGRQVLGNWPGNHLVFPHPLGFSDSWDFLGTVSGSANRTLRFPGPTFLKWWYL